MKKQHAMTLVELMIAITIFFAGAGILYEVFFSQRKTGEKIFNKAQIQDTVYNIFQQLEKDIVTCERVVEFSKKHIRVNIRNSENHMKTVKWEYKPDEKRVLRIVDNREFDFHSRGKVKQFELFLKYYTPLTVDIGISLAGRDKKGYAFFRRFSSLVKR